MSRNSVNIVDGNDPHEYPLMNRINGSDCDKVTQSQRKMNFRNWKQISDTLFGLFSDIMSEM